MSQPMKVKVKYVQEQLYIAIFGIYLWCQAAIPIVDILIGFGVMAAWLILELWPKDWTPMTEFSVFWVFFRPSCPHRQKLKILSR